MQKQEVVGEVSIWKGYVIKKDIVETLENLVSFTDKVVFLFKVEISVGILKNNFIELVYYFSV